MHWDGSAWSAANYPELTRLYAVTAVATDDVWAVGGQAAHWNGSTWSSVPLALPLPTQNGAGQRLYGVAAQADAAVANTTATSFGGSTTSGSNNRSSVVWGVDQYSQTSESSYQAHTQRFKPQFSDVPASNPFYSHIKSLSCSGILSGYSDGTFRPANNITRGQLSKIFSSAAGFSDDPGPQLYQDVKPDDPFYT